MSLNDVPRMGDPYLPSLFEGAFDQSALVGHFRLSESELDVPDGWISRSISTWKLVHDPEMRILDVKCEGETQGWMIGYPVSPDGALVEHDLEWCPENPGSVASAEQFLYSHSGRFIAILFVEGRARVYLDPVGSYGLLFSQTQRIASSSMFLIPAEGGIRDRSELVQALGIPGAAAVYPFGLTPRESVEYLMPNHYLDLAEWTVHRHWPRGDLDLVDDPQPLVGEIVEGIRRNLGSVARTGPLQMSITAGRDSRMMLAAARPLIDNINLVTLAINDRIGRPDTNVAPRIARATGARHRVIHCRRPSRNGVALWVYRTGCMVDELRGLRLIRAMRKLDPTQPYVMGSGGESGRAEYWRAGDTEDTAIDGEGLVGRTNTRLHPEVHRRANKWLETLPVRNALTILDVFQIEYDAGWLGFLMYGYPDAGRYHFFPYSDRRVLEAMLRLPGEYRWKQRLADDIVSMEWPELGAFPYNEAAFGVLGMYRRARHWARETFKQNGHHMAAVT